MNQTLDSGNRSYSYLLGSPPDLVSLIFQVRQLAGVRVDHHPDHHRQLRRHVTRRQAAGRRQDHLVDKNGRNLFDFFKL